MKKQEPLWLCLPSEYWEKISIGMIHFLADNDFIRTTDSNESNKWKYELKNQTGRNKFK